MNPKPFPNPMLNKPLVRYSLPLCALLLFFITLGQAQAQETHLSQLPNWSSERFTEAWPSWLKSCQAFSKKKLANWQKVCQIAQTIEPSNENIRRYFENNFQLIALKSAQGTEQGIITGYYEPIIAASRTQSNVFRYPIYRKPQSKTLQNQSRREIETQPEKYRNEVLLWTDDPYALFFLHVQGSGKAQLEDGSIVSIAYAGNNGHPYTSIGKVLIQRNELKAEEVSLETLSQWLKRNPDKAQSVLNQNKRYIFFNLSDSTPSESGPRGSLNVPLTPLRSIAIDPEFVVLGSPIFLQTKLPSKSGQPTPFNRLMFAQDTGAAIKGQIRADIFFGQGEQAKYLAGNMNQLGKMYLLNPK